jgi:hypothetical protein
MSDEQNQAAWYAASANDTEYAPRHEPPEDGGVWDDEAESYDSASWTVRTHGPRPQETTMSTTRPETDPGTGLLRFVERDADGTIIAATALIQWSDSCDQNGSKRPSFKRPPLEQPPMPEPRPPAADDRRCIRCNALLMGNERRGGREVCNACLDRPYDPMNIDDAASLDACTRPIHGHDCHCDACVWCTCDECMVERANVAPALLAHVGRVLDQHGIPTPQPDHLREDVTDPRNWGKTWDQDREEHEAKYGPSHPNDIHDDEAQSDQSESWRDPADLTYAEYVAQEGTPEERAALMERETHAQWTAFWRRLIPQYVAVGRELDALRADPHGLTVQARAAGLPCAHATTDQEHGS